MAEDEIEHILNRYFTVPVGADYDPNVLQKLKKFEVRDSDVFVVGHAKTGTTWAQEMVWLIANDLDFKGAKTFIDERFPVLELFSFYGCMDGTENIAEYHINSLEYINKLKNPRFIKTHMRGSYLPEQVKNRSKMPKIIYIARNAKDTCLSMYYFFKHLLKIYSGNLEDFCKVFIAGRLGSDCFWKHVLYFWERRNESNVLFIKYENMKDNLSDVIRQVAIFLDKKLTDGEVTALITWLHFDSMKNNSSVNHNDLYKQSGFVRSGKVGSFKEEISPDMINKFNEWTRECLKGSDLNM